MKQKHLILSLDGKTISDTKEIVKQTKKIVNYYRPSKELCYSYGIPLIIRCLKGQGVKTFIDINEIDMDDSIPVSSIIAAQYGADMVSINTTFGETIGKTVKQIKEINPEIKIVANPPHTSESAYYREAVLWKTSCLVKQYGLDGIVCTNEDTELVRYIVGDEALVIAKLPTAYATRIFTPRLEKQLDAMDYQSFVHTIIQGDVDAVMFEYNLYQRYIICMQEKINS